MNDTNTNHSLFLRTNNLSLPQWLLDEAIIEPEKRKVVLFIRKGETLSEGIRFLGNKLGRMPTDAEIITHFQ